MEWDKQKCLQLIDIYEQYPALWNPGHGLYYNKIKKRDSWVRIAEIMGCDSAEVKKKMESLLASFRREKGRGTKTVGAGKGKQKIYLSKWFAFKKLAFLLDRDEPTKRINFLEVDIKEYKETYAGHQSERETGTQQSQNRAVKIETDDNTAEKETEPAEKRTLVSKNQKIVYKPKKSDKPEVDKIDEAFHTPKNATEKRKFDGCDDYCTHVANKLRNYSERTQAFVQYHINNILFQADMGQFEISQHTTTPLPTSSSTIPIQPFSPTFVSIPSPQL